MDDLRKLKRMHKFLNAVKHTSQWIWSKIRKPILFVGYILGKILEIVVTTFEVIADILMFFLPFIN